MRIGVGIDTGGTYTDAVIYDFDGGQVVATAKSPTTREDLSVGILGALDALPSGYLKTAEIISLSTTLATNACVEDRGGNAKLIFFGGNPTTIDRIGVEYGLPPSAEMLVQDCATRFSGEVEREPDWELFKRSIRQGFVGLDGVGIVELYAIRNSAVIEKKARDIFRQTYDMPVICGYELFNELNSLRRGASTLLNARLFPVIDEFMAAINKSLAARDIRADVVIVRSDGSLMSDAFAKTRPVETLLCGPAASVTGSAWLTEEPDSIVVDMGGTTTDIALIKGGEPYKVVGGVSVGRWKTFVGGLYIKTFGLGGDTAIHYDDSRGLFLEDYRVTPLCAVAARYPAVTENLKRLLASGAKHTRYLHEHFLLVRGITDERGSGGRYTADELALCAALKDGPLILRDAAARVPGRDIYNLNAARLIKEGVVALCGLTPTDIMHIKGDFSSYPRDASVLGARFAANNLGISVDTLCDRVYDEIRRKLYMNIVKVMLENKDPYYMKNGVDKSGERFIDMSYEAAKAGAGVGLNTGADFGAEPAAGGISLGFSTGYVLTGVGAPVRIFLDDVAKLLGTRAVVPEHYAVANALGAIVGNVYATNTVEVRPVYGTGGITGYTVFGNSTTETFDYNADAEVFAIAEAEAGARAEARRRGAGGEIAVTSRLEKNVGEAKDSKIYLGSRAVARAVAVTG